NESEYLINKSVCRLKDIVDLTLDSGLGRDSLSIITQGNIQAFAEAKPIERRALFEEAASVSKYKKRKIESLNKLARTQENIDRLNDIFVELQKQVTPLQKQAIKAQQYQKLKDRLTEIEIAVIVNEIKNLNADLQTIEQQLFDLSYKETTTNASITILENDTNLLSEEINTIDSEVHKLQDKLYASLNDIQLLEKRKAEIEQKSRYIRENGDLNAKTEETFKAMNAANLEYQDRLDRKNETEAQIDLINQSIVNYDNQLFELKKKIDTKTNDLAYLNNRKSVLENQLKAPYDKENGVKTILENKNNFDGIYDAVNNLFTVDDGYQLMAATALASSVYHIVTKDDAAAREAIKFLKKNKAGSATFLPLNVLKARYVNKDSLVICENTPGFLGLASDFVDCQPQYDVVVLNLLGNVIVSDNLDNAVTLAKRLNYQYRIVTLEGDVINRGGSLSGGYNKRNNSPVNASKQLDEITRRIASLNQDVSYLNDEYTLTTNKRQKENDLLVNKRIQLASINEVLEIKKEKYEKLTDEYNQLKPLSDQDSQPYDDQLTQNLNQAYKYKDDITNEIALKRERRLTANNELNRKNIQIKQVRRELNDTVSTINSLNIEKAKTLTNRDNQLSLLSRDYQLTYEFASAKDYDIDITSAKSEVVQLRKEISALGNVNLDAPQDYAKVNERYQFMDNQIKELTASKENLLGIINEMDETMSVQFKQMFDKINASLNEVFTVLFGGGRAKLFLEDENDILNSGIDIDVQPPGKSVQNIRLFSGGEKSLIAICVLFAILKARQIPLCIFDEVEASLDQGNVDRFAKYIHKFSGQSQFIVITHRPGTMMECDVLYGVTMQKKGVSNILRVKLKDALDYVKEENDGTVQ
ncbi:MAG: chromosome segregation protein SMC, partial [Erysipelotrichaceae bacterium]